MEAFADISAGMDVDWDSGVFCAAVRSPRFPVYFHDYDIVQFSGVLRTTMRRIYSRQKMKIVTISTMRKTEEKPDNSSNVSIKVTMIFAKIVIVIKISNRRLI